MANDFDALRRVLGTNVRAFRLASEMSQEALAFDAEIDRTYVSQIERAVINPSLLILHKIAKVLRVSVADLLTSRPKSEVSVGRPPRTR